ncbi:hypothetical protein LOK49_LG02G00574 [Camellia lanceoleosa]|uniref:Uncharacterized protein n=1 Tax=Camellia lanceoleosa TaxID=1840588 RepID=A0ACC0IS78_9ERIC|nr:hypothetical protein LOK49_LG02G00574 [Camellia lanceoleosa]
MEFDFDSSFRSENERDYSHAASCSLPLKTQRMMRDITMTITDLAFGYTNDKACRQFSTKNPTLSSDVRYRSLRSRRLRFRLTESHFLRRRQPSSSSANHHHNHLSSAVTPPTNGVVSQPTTTNPRVQQQQPYINPSPHVSTQFYTFNTESHALMIQCILESRAATADEIRAATPMPVLSSWRAVWKDRNEDTAYLTAWKRIQDKLIVHVDEPHGNQFLCFKNNSNQFVSHVNQWQDIVMRFHVDSDLKHLGLKETVERIKQSWTVGAKFYGIPESFIKVCISACPVCSSDLSGSMQRNKRRRFEYTESFDVPANEVPHRLRQLAAKHKVVLCIRQKYIRYKPFMAEVKDYACHRKGVPAPSKKSKVLKREPSAQAVWLWVSNKGNCANC